MTTEEPKRTRKVYTTEEKLARLKSQEQMILDREREKKRERVEEALVLLQGIDGTEAAQAALRAWLG